MRFRARLTIGVLLVVAAGAHIAHAELDVSPDSPLQILTDDGAIKSIDWPPKESSSPPIAPHQRADLSADAAALVAGNNQFAIDMYQRLSSQSNTSENVLLSPFSISTALAMTYAGASGHTAQQMADVLRFSLPDDRLHAASGELLRDLDADREGYQMNVANRLFGQAGYPFKQSFLDITGRDYGAPLEAANFALDPDGSRRRINEWVEDETHDKIRDLLPEGSIKENTRLVLTNAIHFNGSWKYKFDGRFTRDETFYAPDGQSPVSMMFQQERFGYAERPGFQMLEMPYAGDDLSMVIMLPTEHDGLASLESSLTSEILDESLAALHSASVNVHLPKFKFDSSFRLSGALKKMGMTNAFDPRSADLTEIADASGFGERLFIDDALHKAFIEVKEEGTEAAATTAVTIGAASVCYCPPPTPKEFRADHPFLFAIRDRHSGSLLFLGRVADPGELTSTAESLVPEPASLFLLIIGLAAPKVLSRSPRPA